MRLIKEFLNKLILFIPFDSAQESVRQTHLDRNQLLAVRPELIEGLNQRFLKHLFCILVMSNLLGCTIQPVVNGFRPIYPELLYSVFAKDIVWTEVNSLSPTLSWQPYPGEKQTGFTIGTEPFVALDLGTISDIRYDLKIWDVRDNRPDSAAYSAEGLGQTKHTIGQALKPNTEYYWSVRARFKLNGQSRLSEWSRCICISGLYRFKTPAR